MSCRMLLLLIQISYKLVSVSHCVSFNSRSNYQWGKCTSMSSTQIIIIKKNNLELQYKNILLLRQSVLTPCEVSLSWDHSKHNSQRIIESIKALVRTWWHLKITMSFLGLYPTQLNLTKIGFSSNMSYFCPAHSLVQL